MVLKRFKTISGSQIQSLQIKRIQILFWKHAATFTTTNALKSELIPKRTILSTDYSENTYNFHLSRQKDKKKKNSEKRERENSKYECYFLKLHIPFFFS